MKIYLSGTMGCKKRAIVLLGFMKNYLISFYEINYDLRDQHFQQRTFEMIKEINENKNK